MTEDDARNVIGDRWGADAVHRLIRFEQLLGAESTQQNLISPGSMPHLWGRHFLDSAQLCAYDSAAEGSWIDIGTGAGFPGLVVGILKASPTILVEPRARRVVFLQEVVERLSLSHVTVFEGKAEALKAGPARTISARAVASVEKLMGMTAALRDAGTTLVFPRGRNGRDELASLPKKWQKLFHVEQSLTDPGSFILVANGAS